MCYYHTVLKSRRLDIIVDCLIVHCGLVHLASFFFFFQAEDGIRDHCVTGVQTCALPISWPSRCAMTQGTPAKPIMPRRQRSKEPKPFTGFTHKPPCTLCEPETAHPQPRPPGRPEIGRASCRERV